MVTPKPKKRPGPKLYGDDAPPALYIHCVNMYNKMLEQATDTIISPLEPENKMIVYKGFLTHLVANQALSVPYFTFCTRALKEMGCIRQLKRGGGRAPSLWELIKAPTEELYIAYKPEDTNSYRLAHKGKTNMLSSQVSDLSTRVLALEDKLDKLMGIQK